MLSQNPSAIRMRRHRARLRAESPRKPAGRPIAYAKQAALIAAYDLALTKGDYALDRLVYRAGYASRKSLRCGYRWAKKSLALAADQSRWPGRAAA